MDFFASIPSAHQVWLLNSPLAPHIHAFATHLDDGRYAAKTTKGYVSCIAHFARWMTLGNLPVHLLDEHAVEQFLDHHLPRCDCPPPVMRVHYVLRAALGHLLVVLREQRVIAEPTPPAGYIADELQRYDEHMHKSRGLSASTRRGRIRIVRRLLHRYAGRPVMIGELGPDDLRQFIAEQLELCRTTSNAANMASALRAYFRFRATCGDRVQGLLGVINSPAHWSLASLPCALDPAEVDLLLDSFTSSLPSRRRGYVSDHSRACRVPLALYVA